MKKTFFTTGLSVILLGLGLDSVAQAELPPIVSAAISVEGLVESKSTYGPESFSIVAKRVVVHGSLSLGAAPAGAVPGDCDRWGDNGWSSGAQIETDELVVTCGTKYWTTGPGGAGAGAVCPGDCPASTKGGNGGHSGFLFIVNKKLTVEKDCPVGSEPVWFILTGPGGPGGAATAGGFAGANDLHLGKTGCDAEGLGGHGGWSAFVFAFRGDVEVDLNPASELYISLGAAGVGGGGAATGGAGGNATHPAPDCGAFCFGGDGGGALACGGNGGSVFAGVLRLDPETGSVTEVLDFASLYGTLSFLKLFTGGPAGANGLAAATGGNGGNAVCVVPRHNNVSGGDGGDARVYSGLVGYSPFGGPAALTLPVAVGGAPGAPTPPAVAGKAFINPNRLCNR